MLYFVLFIGVPLVSLIALIALAGWFFVKDRSSGGVVVIIASLLVAGLILLYFLFLLALSNSLSSSTVNLF